jgi:hypothetical protein
MEKFLLQVRDGQDPHVYPWTASLAQRKDMKPITEEEATKYKSGDFNAPAETVIPEVIEEEPTEDNPILTGLESEENPDLNSKLELTQDDLLIMELENLQKFRKTNTLEAYFLRKYKLEFIPGTLEELKAQGTEFLEELAKTEKLYK